MMTTLSSSISTVNFSSFGLFSGNNTETSTLNIGSRSKCDLDWPECLAARYLWLVSIPIVLLLGTIGNTLILIVMTRKPLRQTAFARYLAAISITDTIAIWVGMTRHFIKHAFFYDIRHAHISLCWLQRFLLYGSINTSVWLLTAVTFERTFSTISPHRSRMFKSLKKTWVIIILVSVIQYLWNIQIFFTRGRSETDYPNATFTCGYVSEAAKQYWDNYHQYLALVDYSVLPFILMLTMNIMIFAVIKKRARFLAESANLSELGKKNIESVSHKTLMLLPVTIFFLVSTLPSIIFTRVEDAVKTEGRDRARMELADFCVTLLLYLNHSLNFFLYCLTGQMFRQKCKQVLEPICCLFGKRKQAFIADPTWDTVYTRSPKASPRLAGSSRIVMKQNLPAYTSMLSVQNQQLEDNERLYVSPSHNNSNHSDD